MREADPSLLGRAVFIDLGRAVKEHPELLKRYLLTEAVLPGADYFSALHAAFWTGGTLLYVPRGASSRLLSSLWQAWEPRAVWR